MEEKNKLTEVFTFLKERSLIGKLAERADVSRGTISATFACNNVSDLKGKQIDVFQEAVKMVEEINQLATRAEEALA